MNNCDNDLLDTMLWLLFRLFDNSLLIIYRQKNAMLLFVNIEYFLAFYKILTVKCLIDCNAIVTFIRRTNPNIQYACFSGFQNHTIFRLLLSLQNYQLYTQCVPM